MHDARRWTDMGQPLAISPSDLEAHCRLRRIPLRPEEAELIQRLDRAYRAVQSEAAAKTKPAQYDDWGDED